MIQFARPPGQATRSSNKVVSFKKFSFFIRSPKGAGRRPPVFSAAVHSGCFFAGNTAGLPIDAEGLFRAISQKRSADHIQMRSALRLCVQLIPIFNLRITFAIVARMDDSVKSGLAAGFLPIAGSSVLPCASLCASLHPVSGQDHTVDSLPVRYDRPCCNTDCPGSHERIRSGSSRPAMLHTMTLFFRAYRSSFHAGGCRRINSPQRSLLRAPFDRTRTSDRRYTPDRSELRLLRPPGISPGCRRNSFRRWAPSIPPERIRRRR